MSDDDLKRREEEENERVLESLDALDVALALLRDAFKHESLKKTR